MEKIKYIIYNYTCIGVTIVIILYDFIIVVNEEILFGRIIQINKNEGYSM
jgi:hypothetical protein